MAPANPSWDVRQHPATLGPDQPNSKSSTPESGRSKSHPTRWRPDHRHPRALDFFDQAVIEKATGSPVRSQYSKPGAPRSQIPDAIIVALASYNTINKWALGISDTYALGVLAETTGLDIPIVSCRSSTPHWSAASPSAAAAEGVPHPARPRRIAAPKVAESAPIGSRRGTAQPLSTRGSARACRRPGPRR